VFVLIVRCAYTAFCVFCAYSTFCAYSALCVFCNPVKRGLLDRCARNPGRVQSNQEIRRAENCPLIAHRPHTGNNAGFNSFSSSPGPGRGAILQYRHSHAHGTGSTQAVPKGRHSRAHAIRRERASVCLWALPAWTRCRERASVCIVKSLRDLVRANLKTN
jgi:hypothetical protein